MHNYRFIITSRVALIPLLFMIGVLPLFAQQAAQQTLQAQNTTGAVPSSLQSNSDTGDIEVVDHPHTRDIVTASTTQSYFFTSNAFLNDSKAQQSSAYHGNYKAVVTPYSTFNWTPYILFQYDMYRYNEVSAADFDSQSVTLASPYFFTSDHAWTWTPSISLSRFTSPRVSNSEIYKEVTYDNQISHVQRLSSTMPIYLQSAYNLTYRQADPGQYTRLENALTEAISYQITPQLTAQAYVRPAAYYYTNSADADYNGSRTDLNVSSGAVLTYQPIKYLKIDTTFSNLENFSDKANHTYNAIVPGASVTGTYSF